MEGEELIKTFFKKPKTNVSANLRRQVWDLYIGPSQKIVACPLCGIDKISSHDSNGGFQACHIVADKFFTGELSVYYLFPGCQLCNNNCSTLCIFDYLFCRGRIPQLRNLISKVVNAFISENVSTMNPEILLAPKILDYLYGKDRFRAGGGIVNTKQIFEIARLVHYNEILEEGARLAKLLRKNSETLENLLVFEVKSNEFN